MEYFAEQASGKPNRLKILREMPWEGLPGMKKPQLEGWGSIGFISTYRYR
jgi:hypothetical protein